MAKYATWTGPYYRQSEKKSNTWHPWEVRLVNIHAHPRFLHVAVHQCREWWVLHACLVTGLRVLIHHSSNCLQLAHGGGNLPKDFLSVTIPILVLVCLEEIVILLWKLSLTGGSIRSNALNGML